MGLLAKNLCRQQLRGNKEAAKKRLLKLLFVTPSLQPLEVTSACRQLLLPFTLNQIITGPGELLIYSSALAELEAF